MRYLPSVWQTFHGTLYKLKAKYWMSLDTHGPTGLLTTIAARKLRPDWLTFVSETNSIVTRSTRIVRFAALAIQLALLIQRAGGKIVGIAENRICNPIASVRFQPSANIPLPPPPHTKINRRFPRIEGQTVDKPVSSVPSYSELLGFWTFSILESL
jgi:hypothetical protein